MGEPAKVWKELEFVTEACYTCGTLFGLPAQYQRDRRADRKSFYCPNGHSQAYVGKNEADLLKEQLEAKQRELDEKRRDADWQRQLREKTDKKLRKVERRINNGVCPRCNRTFGNIARHMQSKHPDKTKAA